MIEFKHSRIWGIVLAVIVFGGIWLIERREGEGRKDEIVAELSEFARFAEFEDLLLTTLDNTHAETYRRHTRRRGSQRMGLNFFNHSAYREDMYIHMSTALKKAGHADAATELRRFRKNLDSLQPGRSG